MKIQIPQEVEPRKLAQTLRHSNWAKDMIPFLAELAELDAPEGQAKRFGERLAGLTDAPTAKSITAYLRELADGIDEGAASRWPKP